MTDITLTAADGHQLSAYRADPTGTPLGGVVVVQEIFGVNAHIRSVVDRFAAAGFVAVAPALFDRERPGVELGYDQVGMEAGVAIAWNLPIEIPLADVGAAAGLLAGELGGPSRVATVGFCWGGMLSLATACRHGDRIGAAVGYYPSRSAKVLAGEANQVPILIHVGEHDRGIPPEDVDAMAALWPDATIHRYDAGHGFNCDLRADFAPEAAAEAWERTTTFLANALGGEGS